MCYDYMNTEAARCLSRLSHSGLRMLTQQMLLQVVVAVDDSRSMGENGCGSFALEAVTLICRAMARLEVGEMGVVSYGGSNSILPLHPLEKPFTDADGPGIMAQMKFSQVPALPSHATTLQALLCCTLHNSVAYLLHNCCISVA